MSDQHNENEEQTQVDAIAEDMPIDGEVAEQIVTQINSEGEGHPPIPEELSLLPLRDTVIFPVLVAPIAVGRENSIKLVDEAVSGGDRIIGVVALKDSSVENPAAGDIYPMGVAVIVRMMAKVPDGIRMIVQGVARIQIQQITSEEPYLKARVKVLDAKTEIAEEDKVEIEALKRSIGELFRKTVALSQNMPDELAGLSTSIDDPAVMTDLIAAHSPISAEDKQRI